MADNVNAKWPPLKVHMTMTTGSLGSKSRELHDAQSQIRIGITIYRYL
jgi:hypothetical protein